MKFEPHARWECDLCKQFQWFSHRGRSWTGIWRYKALSQREGKANLGELGAILGELGTILGEFGDSSDWLMGYVTRTTTTNSALCK